MDKPSIGAAKKIQIGLAGARLGLALREYLAGRMDEEELLELLRKAKSYIEKIRG